MFEIVAFAATLALPVQTPKPKAEVDPAKEFEATLTQVQELVQHGSFERAETQLYDLLERHDSADYAKRRKTEIVELARRCAFQLSRPAPKLADLVSGELVRYDAHSGEFEIRYLPGHTSDFLTEASKSGEIMRHPAMLLDTWTAVIACPAGMAPKGDGPEVLVGLGTDEEFQICFGAPHASGTSYTPAQIQRANGAKGELLDEEKKSVPSYDKKCELKVVVGPGSVTAYRNGARILQARRSSHESGLMAFVDVDGFERLTLKGKMQPSWPQGLLDEAAQIALAKFDEKWKAQSELPAWLFEAAKATNDGGRSAASASPADAQAVLDAKRAFHARLNEVLALIGKRTPTELEAEWKKLVDAFPREPEVHVGLAYAELRAGRLEAVQATCDAALAAGIRPESLDPLPQMIVKARTGPEWRQVFSYASDHYVVKSDIDKNICVEATKVLEESYRSYSLRLAAVPDLEQRKFAVFLFSGQAGYLDYARGALLDAPANTAGLYSPLLKQLLIWNLPDRAEMFKTIRHEGFHQYLDRLADAPATWFNEGMAEYYELADLYGGDWKEGQVNRDWVDLLRASSSHWIPLRELLEMTPEDFYGTHAERHYAQSWAVVHYLRQGPKDAQELFKRFWDAVVHGKTNEQATNDAFGTADLAPLEEAVKRHVDGLKAP